MSSVCNSNEIASLNVYLKCDLTHRIRTFLSVGMTLLISCTALYSQKHIGYNHPDTFNSKRFKIAVIGGGLAYTATTITLYHTWYAKEDLGKFHGYNDWGEWENVDKAGHMFSSWFGSYFIYKGARWTGIPEKKAVWAGAGTAMLFQTTLEILDGFSNDWGFSWSDMAFNALGAGSFVFQQLHWGEQRILMKTSAIYRNYDTSPVLSADGNSSTSRKERANDLFGSGSAERFLKDYNAQTTWASVNVHSFLKPNNKWPAWLNLAFGYSADDMYGGYENSWPADDGSTFNLPEQRYKQFFFSIDLDLRKIKTRSSFLRTVLFIANIIKIPAPALEINSKGEFKFYGLYF